MTENTNTKKLTFLHLTDCHLSSAIDIKAQLKGVEQQSRSEILRTSLRGLAETLKEKRIKLDAVLFSGDGTFQGDPDGQVLLREMLLNTLVEVGISKPSQIVATPGNHDIVAKSEPSKSTRYELFHKAWINTDSVIVPFLDGIHEIEQLSFSTHVLEAPDRSWAVFPINTANWSQTSLSEDENEGLALLKKYVEESKKPEIIKALEKVCSHDVARVSKDQLEALRKLVQQTQKGCLKIAVLHHHLLPVNSNEEVKTFADITNLGHFREVLHELGFHIIVHGHKHATAAYYDAPFPNKSYSESTHPILVVSGGTFGPTGNHPNTPLQLIEIDDLPHAPICKVMDIGAPISGCALKLPDTFSTYRLWEESPSSKGPVSIYGTSIDDVYARAKQTIEKFPERTMICTIDFQTEDEDAFPLTYPHWGNHAEKRDWFRETVKWWQLPASQIETRIPYIHGSRLRRFGGSLDQIKRVIRLLREEKKTSKAIALIIDPGRDFGEKPFASFCFVQFCLRSNNRLDCIGYYRAQEFHHWWPVNVAELRHLQLDIAKETGIDPGEITTISPYPRLSENIRQPTKVAVPLIDQWVDNHPKRIAQIALALANHGGESHEEGIKLWERCLDDFERAATDFHKDGIQVSIEGLRLLKDWLNAASGPDPIIDLIGALLNENVLNQDNLTERKKFELWKDNVATILQKLRQIPLGSQKTTAPSF
jgi:3',5'-cyclic AMP phosphodiesterase CpdA